MIPRIEFGAVAVELLSLLVDLTGGTICVEWEPETNQFGVWLSDVDGDGPDLIGSGDCTSEALADALTTVRRWEQQS